ncbi:MULTISPECIES: hypothetical protein [unclassified Neglectibacter]|uniref:hypothetical protein n=1 Tax=unclassified Neglectibacter TaxID=2632164 RepID=UPI0013692C03|nr:MULTISPECIES: hypothetical protein [unclassified Neglectibacter]
MTKEMVRESIRQHLAACKPSPIEDEEASIFGEQQQFEARDLAYLCLQMKTQYGCDLNPVVQQIRTCSVSELTNAFWSALREQPT